MSLVSWPVIVALVISVTMLPCLYVLMAIRIQRTMYRRAMQHAESHLSGRSTQAMFTAFPPAQRDIAHFVIEAMRDHIDVDVTRIHPDDQLIHDLGLGSFDFLEPLALIRDVEDHFHVRLPEDLSPLTVRQIVRHTNSLRLS